MSMLLKVAIVLLIAFVFACSLALLFSARPTPLLGIDGDSLIHSIGKGDTDDGCRKIPSGKWVCSVSGDSHVVYVVDVGWDGCWNATNVEEPVDNYTPEKLSGCVDIWDHLELEDTFN